MKPGKPIAFICYGGFSHINANVERQLRRVFLDRELHLIDVAELLFRWPARTAGLALAALRRPGPLELLRRMDPRDSLLQTPAAYHLLRREIRWIVTELDCLFSFQTQSMWDGSTPGVPHFVYTDHTELANLGYPAFNPKRLMPRWWLDLEAEIYRNAARVFTMSRHVTRSLREDYGLAAERLRCVRAGGNAPGSGEIRAALPAIAGSGPEILFVGVDWTRKGGPELLEAFKRLRRDHPTARLRIVGCTPKIAVAGCEVMGRVPLEEMPALYASASIFCLPTRIEPFGIAFVEAMHAGLPVVGTRVGAVPDMVREGVNGLLVPPGDIDALHSALDSLLRAPDSLPAMGRASRERAARHYNWQAVGDRLGGAIREVLANPPDKAWTAAVESCSSR